MLVWVAFGGQTLFVASWVVGGAIAPHYTHVLDSVSDLAGRGAAHPALAIAGMAALGVSLCALGAALATVLPRRAALPVALFAGAGLAVLVAAAVRLDCSFADHHCRALWHAGRLSWHQDVHLWASLATDALLLATPFALARALWPGTPAAATLAAGSSGLTLAGASIVAYAIPGAAGGLVERADLAVLHLWVLAVGVAVLYATRPAPRVSDLIPMRPRDFLAQTWTGDGELVLWPFALGRLFAQRVEARRETTWIDDRLFRIDDEAHFGGGRFERRTTFCEFVDDDHVRLTADDLLDGADVWLEPDGFRIAEFRMAWPVGPLPLIVRVVDRSYFEPGGTFVNTMDVLSLGPRIPLARVTFRMRPLATAPPRHAADREIGLT